MIGTTLKCLFIRIEVLLPYSSIISQKNYDLVKCWFIFDKILNLYSMEVASTHNLQLLRYL